MIKVGVIGCGVIAQNRHIPEYMQNHDCEIVALASRNVEKTKELAQTHGWTVFDDYKKLLDDKSIDAVSICTSNETHAQIAVEALKKGKHVLCEKPMAISLKECESMIFEAEKQGKLLMIAHNQRLENAHVKAKQLIEQGCIGDIISFHTQFCHGGPEQWRTDSKKLWFFDKDKAGSGAMIDLGIHKTDLLQYLTGMKIIKVNANIATLDKKDLNGEFINVDDNAICIYTLENNAIGTMSASWTSYGNKSNETVLYGTKGVMSIYKDDIYPVKIDFSNGEKQYFTTQQLQREKQQNTSGIVDMFISSILTGNECELSGKNVLHAMKAVFAAIESSAIGKEIILDIA